MKSSRIGGALLIFAVSYAVGWGLALVSQSRGASTSPVENSKHDESISQEAGKSQEAGESMSSRSLTIESRPDERSQICLDWNAWTAFRIPPIDDFKLRMSGELAVSTEMRRILRITEQEAAQVDEALAEMAERIAADSRVIRLDLRPGEPLESATRFQIPPSVEDGSERKETLKKRFFAALGNARSEFFFQKIEEAAYKNPLLRGFGTLELTLNFQAADDTGLVGYTEVLRDPDSGKNVSSISRDSYGVPPSYRRYFTLEQ